MRTAYDKLDPLEAYKQVMHFSAQHRENALRLALHAAVPQVLRPDLLHLLRLNFVPESIDDSTVEADVLFASFCEELGNGYFRFDRNSRLQLLTQLDPAYENDAVLRSQQVADFLLAYIDRQSHNVAVETDPVFLAYLDVERWVALAFLDPEDAARQLAVAVKKSSEESAVAARMRIGGLASALATPLAMHRELLAFAAGLDALEAGDVRQAENLIEPLGDREIQVGDVTLRSPRSMLRERLRARVEVIEEVQASLSDGRDIEWVSPGEAAAALNNMAARLRTMASVPTAAEQKRLMAMARWLEQKKWLAHGSVSAALGRVFGEAKVLDRAIQYYQLSLSAKDGQITLKDIEQLANFQAREVARRMKDGDPKSLLPDIDQAIHLLEMVMGLTRGRSEELGATGQTDLPKTGERLSLLASSYKRKAWISATDRENALTQMARFYRDAFELAQAEGRFDAYPLLNWLTGELCSAWQKGLTRVDGETVPNRLRLLTQAQDELDLAIQKEKSFWNVVMRVDAELLQALWEGELGAKQINFIAEKYRYAARLGSPREYASVLDQIDFLIVMAGAQKQVAKDLTSLRRKLEFSDGKEKQFQAGGQIFISYASENLDMVRKVYSGLVKRKLNVWFDKEHIGTGKWKPQIKRAILRSRYFIICLSNAALKSMQTETRFQDYELNQAYGIAINQPEQDFTIIPVRLEDCIREDHRLSLFQQYDLFPDFEKALDKLAVDLGGVSLSDQKVDDERTESDKMIDLFAKANTAYHAGRYKQSITLFDSVLMVSPNNSQAWGGKGAALEGLNRHKEAIMAYDQALKIKPDDAEIWYKKGIALGSLGKYQEALQTFDQALKIKPDFAEAWFNKGDVLRSLGKSDEAVYAYDQGLKIKPNDSKALRMRDEMHKPPTAGSTKGTLHYLRIFLSSPGDVSRERQLAREVIERIQSERAYRDRLKLEVVAWDKPGAGTAMPAQMEPQEAINRGIKKPSECDIVIVIFWARMGTPLPEKLLKPDGSRYRSGTEYEFLEGLEAAQKTGKPDVLIYRRKEPPALRLRDPERKEKERQWELIEEFFAEFRNPDGAFKSFYKEYDEPSDFEKELDHDLRDAITRILDSLTSTTSDTPTTTQPQALKGSRLKTAFSKPTKSAKVRGKK